MASKIAQLEERVARAERDIQELKSAPICSPQNGHLTEEPGWRKIIGVFEDDELYDEAVRLGAEWRRQQREP